MQKEGDYSPFSCSFFKQVSEHLNVTIRSYQRIESGEMLGSIRIWDALEDLFRIPQRELRLAVQRKEEAADRE